MAETEEAALTAETAGMEEVAVAELRVAAAAEMAAPVRSRVQRAHTHPDNAAKGTDYRFDHTSRSSC